MKNFKTIALFAFVFIFASCANIYKFPVSTVAPAADIVVHKQQDENGNSKITVTAKNLSAVERLVPPKNVYVVWIVTENNAVINIGQLKNKNAKTAEIISLSPFKFSEIFITAEVESEIFYPNGIEISRIKF